MIFSNIYNNSMNFMPYSAPKYYQTGNASITGVTTYNHHTFSTQGNEFIFFKSAKPADLFTIESKQQLLDTHGADIITKLVDVQIDWIYNTTTRERFVKKHVDAKDMTVEQDGDIVWCAIITTQEETIVDSVVTSLPIDNTKDSILFTDVIGDWTLDNSVITLDLLTGLTTGSTVVFKDFSMILRDKSINEGAQ